jgi:hypothetical protein
LVNFSLFLRPDCGVQEKNGKLKNARKKRPEKKTIIFLYYFFYS